MIRWKISVGLEDVWLEWDRWIGIGGWIYGLDLIRCDKCLDWINGYIGLYG